jgi:hypothetical protein
LTLLHHNSSCQKKQIRFLGESKARQSVFGFI